MTIGSPPGAGTFCRDGPPSLLHFHHHDVFAADDAADAHAKSAANTASAANGNSNGAASSPTRRQRKRVVLALYDLDGTLIRPKSGYKFPRGSDDWMWYRREVPHRLRADVAAGRHVVVLSNQNVHGRLLQDVKEKIRMIAHAVSGAWMGEIGGNGEEAERCAGRIAKENGTACEDDGSRQIDDVPFRVLAALDRDKFRKPNIGMLEYLLRMYAERGWEIGEYRVQLAGHERGSADSRPQEIVLCRRRGWACGRPQRG